MLSKRVGKMSKSLKNYRRPKEIFDKYGADALRWYFFANQAPWNSIVYSEKRHQRQYAGLYDSALERRLLL